MVKYCLNFQNCEVQVKVANTFSSRGRKLSTANWFRHCHEHIAQSLNVVFCSTPLTVNNSNFGSEDLLPQIKFVAIAFWSPRSSLNYNAYQPVSSFEFSALELFFFLHNCCQHIFILKYLKLCIICSSLQVDLRYDFCTTNCSSNTYS